MESQNVSPPTDLDISDHGTSSLSQSVVCDACEKFRAPQVQLVLIADKLGNVFLCIAKIDVLESFAKHIILIKVLKIYIFIKMFLYFSFIFVYL